MSNTVHSRTITTSRLKTRVLFCGDDSGEPVLFVHGNLSAAAWWEETMKRLPEGFYAIAPDLRGYGEADPAAKIDATGGMADFSHDLAALMQTLGVEAAHCVGHSLGGGVLWHFLGSYPQHVLSLMQVCPSSPYGFGGCKADGTPCFPDNAGAGAGAVNPDFARLLAQGAKGQDSPFHPLSILNTYVWKPPFVPAHIEKILAAALAQHCGPQDYPGDVKASSNWPGAAPGVWGPINAMAPLYQKDPLAFTRIAKKPNIVWLRGSDDPIVSDLSLFDLGTLGSLGAVPGWPGMNIFPPQPMVSQIGAALALYKAQGGKAKSIVMPGLGHSPYLENPNQFDQHFHRHLKGIDI